MGVRLIRSDPYQDDLGRYHYDPILRHSKHPGDLDTDELADTVAVANVPFWCSNLFCLKLLKDVEARQGLYKAGRVPLYMSFSLIQGHKMAQGLSTMGKMLSNYYEVEPVATVKGEYFRPRLTQGSDVIWLRLTPRRKPVIEMPLEELDLLVSLMWKGGEAFQPKRNDQALGSWLANKLVYMTDFEDTAKLGYDNLSAVLLKRANISPSASLKHLTMKELGQLTEALQDVYDLGMEQVEKEIDIEGAIERDENVADLLEGSDKFNEDIENMEEIHMSKVRQQRAAMFEKYEVAPLTKKDEADLNPHLDMSDPANWQAKPSVKSEYQKQQEMWQRQKKPYSSKRRGNFYGRKGAYLNKRY